jgi:hypothetical protein
MQHGYMEIFRIGKYVDFNFKKKQEIIPSRYGTSGMPNKPLRKKGRKGSDYA